MLADFRKLFRQSAIYGLGTFSTKLAGFVLIPVYTDCFTVAQFGILGLLEVTTAVVMAFFGLSLYSAFFRWYWDPSTEGKRESLFFTVVIFQIAVAIFAYFAVFPFLKNLSMLILGSADYTYLFRLMLISSLIQLVLIMPNTLLRLQEKPWLFTLANVVQLTFGLLVTIYFVAYRHSGLEGIFYGQIVGSIAFAIALSRYSLKNMAFRFESKLLKDMLAFCLPLFMSGVALVLFNVTDRYSINSLGKISDVGLYSYGFKLANTLNVFLITSINFAIQPMIFRMMNSTSNKRFYAKLMTYYTLFIMGVGLAMMIFGMEITKLFARRVEYYSAWTIFPFIIFSIVFGMMKDMSITGLSITKKTKIIAMGVLVVTLLNLVLNNVLIRIMGNQGAALSKLLSMLVFFWIMMHDAQKAYPIPYEGRRLAVILLSAAGLYLFSTLFNPWPTLPRLVAKSFLTLSYPFILYLLKFYEPVEIDRIRTGLRLWSNPSALKENIKRMINQ